MHYYINNPAKLKDPAFLELIRRNGDDPEKDVIRCDQFNIDHWEEVQKRYPGQSWKHMSALYGRHEGETILIAGCGKSLMQLPQRVQFTTMAINRAIFRLQATYSCIHDQHAILQASDAPWVKSAIPVRSIQLYEELNGKFAYMIEAAGTPTRWPKDPPLYWNETTLGWAIHLAIRMGAKRIVTIGCDLDERGWYDDAQNPEFDAEEMRRQHFGCRDRMERMFSQEEQPKWRERHVEILDASGGNMPVPKVRLEDVLAQPA